MIYIYIYIHIIHHLFIYSQNLTTFFSKCHQCHLYSIIFWIIFSKSQIFCFTKHCCTRYQELLVCQRRWDSSGSGIINMSPDVLSPGTQQADEVICSHHKFRFIRNDVSAGQKGKAVFFKKTETNARYLKSNWLYLPQLWEREGFGPDLLMYLLLNTYPHAGTTGFSGFTPL